MKHPRIWILSLLVAATLLSAASSQAQLPDFKEVAPLHLTVSTWSTESADDFGVALSAHRTVPLFFFLPSVSEDSRIDLLGLDAGVRQTLPDHDAEFAWAIRPFDAFISKAPWSGGLTLLAYDRSGPLRVEADWLAIRFGPALRIGGFRRSAELRATAEGALSTLGIAGALFPGPRNTSSGPRGGISGAFVGRLGDRLLVNAESRNSWMATGEKPRTRSWHASLAASPGSRVWLELGAGQLEVSSDVLPTQSRWLGFAAIRFTPRKQSF